MQSREQPRCFEVAGDYITMVRQESSSKIHQGKDELVKRDMLDPPGYLRRTEDFRGKALSFGVLDWTQFEKWKDDTSEGTKGAGCSSSYASSYTDSLETPLELDLSTGVAKRLELDLSLSPNMRNDGFSFRSMTTGHQPLSRKQKEHQASLSKSSVEKEQTNASEHQSSPPCQLIFSRQTNPESVETSSELFSKAFRTVECQDDEVHDKCLSPVSVAERTSEKPRLLDHNVTPKKGRDTSPHRRFSFSFSQMGRSLSSKESSSYVPALSSASHTSAKSGPLTFGSSDNANHLTRTKPNGHSRTGSGPALAKSGPVTFNRSDNANHLTRTKLNGHSRTRSGPLPKPPKSKSNIPLPVPSKHSITIQPTMEKSSRVCAILQFTLRKGINLFQFVVDDNINNVLAATMKSSDSSGRSYTLYSVKEVKNKSSRSWLSRHRNEETAHPFVHTILGQVKTVTSITSDSTTHKSESVLLGVETDQELAAIVQTRNMIQRHSTATIILPSGVHTLPEDSSAPLPLIDRWKSGGECDCGGWDIGCKLRVFSSDHTKCQSSSSFQLFDQERDEPAFKMVTHDDKLHSVEFRSSISHLEAFFISLAVSSHKSWCEEEAVLVGDGLLKRETSTKFASNPPVSPIGRV